MTERRTDDQILKDLKSRYDALKQTKDHYKSVIEELIEFCNHTRRRMDDTTKGTVTGANVFDGTANSANKIQADGFFGNLCSQNLRWFAESLPIKMNWPRWSVNMRKWQGKRLDDVPEVKAWLEACGDLLYASFLRSTFYEEMPVLFRDGGSVGCGNMYRETDIEKDRTIFTVLHPREYLVSLDAYGNVDTEFRTYKLTMRQLKAKFDEKALKEEIQSWDQTYDKNPYTEYTVIHAVLPREDYDPGKKDNKNRPWGSYWYLESGKKLLLESGYEHFPFIHWQFNKGNDGYGYGPGHEAYVDIMLANQQAQTNLVAGQKMVEPPLFIHNDLRGLVRVGPKGRTYSDDMNKLPRPLLEGIQLPYALEMLDRTVKVIREKWHVDFFLMLSQAAFEKLDITATQVMEMVSEKATMLGTVIGRIASDILNPIIDLQFYGEQDAGRIPPMPQIMLDSGLTMANIEVDYTGPLAMAQKRAHSTQGIRQGLAFLTEVAQVYQPAVRKVNWAVTLTKGLTDLGFPASCLVGDDEFNAQVQATEKAQAEAMQTEQIANVARSIPGLAKGMEPNSAGEMLVEAMGGKLKEVAQ